MTLTPIANVQLVQQLQAALPVIGGSLQPTQFATDNLSTWVAAFGGQYRIDWSVVPSSGQIATATAIIAGFVPQKPSTLFVIAPLIFALTTVQKNNIITNLFGGTTPLWWSDAGPNASALAAVYAATGGTFTLTQQLIMTAMYVLDNPSYLVNPAFDPTINVPGTQPA